MADFMLDNFGSIFILTPKTKQAKAFLEEVVDPEAIWYGQGLAIEPRYVEDFVLRMQEEEGFTVE